MRGALLASSLVAAVALAGFARLAASTGPIPLTCDRACLEGVMNQFLAAVVKHDPKAAPLSEDVMYTENDQVMKVGDGFWKTAEAVGNYKHFYADPEFGQIAVMATMREAGALLLFSARLRIELRIRVEVLVVADGLSRLPEPVADLHDLIVLRVHDVLGERCSFGVVLHDGGE